MQNYLTINETSTLLKIKAEKVEDLLNKNELYFGVKIGDEWRIGLDDLENYLNKLKEFRMIANAKKHLNEIREDISRSGYKLKDLDDILSQVVAEEQ